MDFNCAVKSIDCIPYILYLEIITNKTFFKHNRNSMFPYFIKLTSDNCNSSLFVKGLKVRILYMTTFDFFNA